MEQPEWNQSTTSERNRPTAEDRMANKIASEVLRDNAKLRGIHSNNSIKILLEKEAKKQMAIAANGGDYTGPVISVIKEKGGKKEDPSNLPYLHKNPAVWSPILKQRQQKQLSKVSSTAWLKRHMYVYKHGASMDRFKTAKLSFECA